jgi:hypothetical protein
MTGGSPAPDAERLPLVMTVMKNGNSSEFGATIAEQVFVVLGLLLPLVVPPFAIEAFPMTASPMFSVTMPMRLKYTLVDNRGCKLDNDVYGLRTSPLWNMEGSFGPQFPKNVVATSEPPADMNALLQHIREVGRDTHAEFPLVLECITRGAVDDRTVGVVSTQKWTIDDGDR